MTRTEKFFVFGCFISEFVLFRAYLGLSSLIWVLRICSFGDWTAAGKERTRSCPSYMADSFENFIMIIM